MMPTAKIFRSVLLLSVAAALSVGACKCPSSSEGEPQVRKVDESPMRRIDLSKKRVLNIRQARKMRPIDKFSALKNRKKSHPGNSPAAPQAQQKTATEPTTPGAAAPQGSQEAAGPVTKGAAPQ